MAVHNQINSHLYADVGELEHAAQRYLSAVDGPLTVPHNTQSNTNRTSVQAPLVRWCSNAASIRHRGGTEVLCTVADRSTTLGCTAWECFDRANEGVAPGPAWAIPEVEGLVEAMLLEGLDAGASGFDGVPCGTNDVCCGFFVDFAWACLHFVAFNDCHSRHMRACCVAYDEADSRASLD